ncbi:FKBP-type peptidyl-prolyl cis-trans isomerase [Pseudohongiella acticola]|uniref:FKBP-type peptidyl-prolyl cis-trans isomerase n=1 Tax=Pseudohongiella acticola TaxID=1524254 RepID=UPI0009F362A8|nr:peptidylprolyl isomerase [Pseudohongiella acticola]
MRDGENNDGFPPTESAAVVCDGARVTLHFSLALPDGTEIDSNYDKAPATFRVGDGNLLPGFEAVLMGAAQGASVSVRLPPEQAFGAVNPDNVQSFPRQRFASLLANTTDPVEEGTVVSFADSEGNEIPGVLKQIGEIHVVIDFNHPLAGREIVFNADIVSVIAPGTEAVKIQL